MNKLKFITGQLLWVGLYYLIVAWLRFDITWFPEFWIEASEDSGLRLKVFALVVLTTPFGVLLGLAFWAWASEDDND